MPTAQQRAFKERLGALVYHPAASIGIVVLILVSVGLVFLHLSLPADDPLQHPVEVVQTVVTLLFVLEISAKAYVAPDRTRFLAQYWVDILAIVPWAQSLRVLRILRLLRVFRAAMILSRRIRFMSALFRSAVGEYLVLAMILLTLVTTGSFVLYLSEHHERERARAAHLAGAAAAPHRGPVRALVAGGRVTDVEVDQVALAEPESLPERVIEAVNLALDDAQAAGAPEPAEDLSNPINAIWATVFFLVANEPMVGVPRTPVGKAVTLVVMFGGLTTFAVFTGVVSALMVNRLRRRMEIDDMDRFQLTDHLVICGWNSLVPLIVEELQVGGQESPAVVIVADLEELPPEISRMNVASSVFFVPGDYTKPELLEQARIAHARRAIIVADSTRPRSDQDRDARTVLAALMIERMNPQIYSCAELLNRANEAHLRAAGIEEVITTSEAGGHHLAMAAMHPGLANVVSELLSAKIGRTLVKEPVPDHLVGTTFMSALEHLKRERNALLLGLEVNGANGPRAPGYSMQVNPPPDTTLAADDQLVLIVEGPQARG